MGTAEEPGCSMKRTLHKGTLIPIVSFNKDSPKKSMRVLLKNLIYLLVGYHGEPKVTLFRGARIT